MKYAPTPVVIQAVRPHLRATVATVSRHARHPQSLCMMEFFARADSGISATFKNILNGWVKMRILGASARPFELFSNEVKKRAKRCTASVRRADTQNPFFPNY